jgi:NADPH2:quinone reductase
MRAKAIRMHASGGPEVLVWEEVEVGDPGPGDVLLRQVAVGLNYIDTYHRSGLYPAPIPGGIGLEGAAVVERVGEGVTGLTPGDRVAYASAPIGAYAEWRVFPAERLVRVPEGVTDQQAAAMMLQGMTAEYLIRRTFAVRTGQWVLFHAAAGGVGLIACQWLAHIGARVIGTAGGAEKMALARAHGCEQVLDAYGTDIAGEVRRITGGAGVAVVYDGVGQATFSTSLDSLARRGMLVSFGNASGPVPPFDPALLSARGSLYFTRPSLMDYTATRAELEESATALFAVVSSGAVQIRVNQTYPLRDAAQAHRDLEGRRTTGSTVLLP